MEATLPTRSSTTSEHKTTSSWLPSECKAYEGLLPVGDIRPSGWDVPYWFGDAVWLNNWSDVEAERAVSLVPREILEPARRHGLSAYVAGGPLVVEYFRVGRSIQPAGAALVLAVTDWRRIGLTAPIPKAALLVLQP